MMKIEIGVARLKQIRLAIATTFDDLPEGDNALALYVQAFCLLEVADELRNGTGLPVAIEYNGDRGFPVRVYGKVETT
jgi:hypothetical protein